MIVAEHIPTIDEAICDPNMLGAGLGDDLDSWRAWRVILKAAWALPLDPDERALFDVLAGGREPPAQRVTELWVIAGRRGGKSRTAGAIAAYAATFNTYKLAPGETATALVLAVTQAQAQVVVRYASGFLHASPFLRTWVEGETDKEIRLRGNVEIRAGAGNFRSVRSGSVILGIFDESAFWHDEDTSRNPDLEIYTAILPTLAASRGMLVGISSAYRRSGLLFRKFAKAYGKNIPNVLVIKATSKQLNPTLDDDIIALAREADGEKASAEWDSEFRSDLVDLVSRETVLACVDADVLERPYSPAHRYVGFVDPSGGSADSFTLAIGHQETDKVVVDAVREIPAPFDPESAVDELSLVLRSYRITSVRGDRYAGEWPRQSFRKRGIEYELAEMPKSSLYLGVVPRLNAKTIRLVDINRLVDQLSSLERRTSRGGRDLIDHKPGGRDDVANAVAGLAAHLVTSHSADWRELRI